MSSEVEICNLGLSNIRGGSINNFDEGSLQAQLCKLKYPIMRNRCLAELPWGFCRKIKPLATVTTEIFNWAYAYQYPVDCLKIHRLIGAYEELSNFDADIISRLIDSQLLPVSEARRKIPYEVFNFDDKKTIGANEAELRVGYSAKVTDPNLFDTDFIMALSHLMSSELAIPIVGGEIGRQFRSDSLQLYKAYLHSAIASDMNEQVDPPAESEYVTVRR
jgi:hypothetical protein